MSSKRVSDALFGDDDLPTGQADVLALRENRPRSGGDWLRELTVLSLQLPPAAAGAPRHRPTFAGFPPFEL
ncbi:MAG: hypothetical protein M3O15_08990 [Acidobacteriota bacterium]|nr:hypothetical protein [Acidobacteriota bacterium]